MAVDVESRVLLNLLRRRYGAVPWYAQEQIEQASSEQLMEWARLVLNAPRDDPPPLRKLLASGASVPAERMVAAAGG